MSERLTDVQLDWWLSHATDDWQIRIGRELKELRREIGQNLSINGASKGCDLLEATMSERTCATCKFWCASKYQGEDMRAYYAKNGDAAECGQQDNFRRMFTIYVYGDGRVDDYEFDTPPDFGCNMHEPIASAPPVDGPGPEPPTTNAQGESITGRETVTTGVAVGPLPTGWTSLGEGLYSAPDAAHAPETATTADIAQLLGYAEIWQKDDPLAAQALWRVCRAADHWLALPERLQQQMDAGRDHGAILRDVIGQGNR